MKIKLSTKSIYLIKICLVFFTFSMIISFGPKSSKNKFINLLESLNEKFDQANYLSFEHLEDLYSSNQVIWHIYEDEDTLIQIAEYKGIVSGIYLISQNINHDDFYNTNRNIYSEVFEDSISFNDNKRDVIVYYNEMNEEINAVFIYVDIDDYKSFLFSDELLYGKQMMYLLNHERKIRNLSKLINNPILSITSKNYSETMIINNHFAHSDLENKSPMERIENLGIKLIFVGENLVRGIEMDPFDAHNKLVNSAGHIKNIVDPNFSHLGIGTTIIDNVTYVCQLFGG